MLGKSQNGKSTFINALMQYAQNKGSSLETREDMQIGNQNSGGPAMGNGTESCTSDSRTYEIPKFPLIRHLFDPSDDTSEEINEETAPNVPPAGAKKLERMYNLKPTETVYKRREYVEEPGTDIAAEFPTAEYGEVGLRIIDTPGIDDNQNANLKDMLSRDVDNMLDIIREVEKVKKLHAILLIIKYGQMNGADVQNKIRFYCEMFGDYSDKIIVLFTGFNKEELRIRDRSIVLFWAPRRTIQFQSTGTEGQLILSPDKLMMKTYNAPSSVPKLSVYEKYLNNVTISEIIAHCRDTQPIDVGKINYIKLPDVRDTDEEVLKVLTDKLTELKDKRANQNRDALDEATEQISIIDRKIKDARRWLEAHDTKEEETIDWIAQHHGPMLARHSINQTIRSDHIITRVHLWSWEDAHHGCHIWEQNGGGVDHRHVTAHFWAGTLRECKFEFGAWTDLSDWRKQLDAFRSLQERLTDALDEQAANLEAEILKVENAIYYMKSKSLDPTELYDPNNPNLGFKLDKLVKDGYMREVPKRSSTLAKDAQAQHRQVHTAPSRRLRRPQPPFSVSPHRRLDLGPETEFGRVEGLDMLNSSPTMLRTHLSRVCESLPSSGRPTSLWRRKRNLWKYFWGAGKKARTGGGAGANGKDGLRIDCKTPKTRDPGSWVLDPALEGNGPLRWEGLELEPDVMQSAVVRFNGTMEFLPIIETRTTPGKHSEMQQRRRSPDPLAVSNEPSPALGPRSKNR
ncbi:hypothetical protein BDK51DRAFT_29964 [Blyttiomyces helicus]|uniref:Dynamin N-terminal domain-containing protein n=1 Tax=Blyttiomyces helicus TaxID=388810 RepID=A0A4P9WF24_9FUNG|nr:hypothetical protein BDK51DRAFT_29964 [Blyttiomyces helicus]|eukprot:RKO89610.1 hypothetical protein BDK51DRAFT_29964 [Blyttiomyces helicus]